jgi:xylulokinase
MALLGIDLGTSSLKALLLEPDGRLLSVGKADYPLLTPRPGWAEADPEDWWQATITAVRAALAQAPHVEVIAVGLAGQMHGLVPLDEMGRLLRPALLWPDRRAAALLARYYALPATLREALANPLVPGMAGPLLCWLAEEEPAVYERMRWALQPKDWLRLRLTGVVAADPSDASATLLYDLPADAWSEEVIAALGLRRDLLAPLFPSGARTGTLSPAAAAALGLPAGLPVATGAADVAAALLGCGLFAPGPLLTVIGTGAQLVLLSTEPRPDPTGRTHLYRAADGRHWYRMAAVQNAGLALDWLRRALRADWEEVYASLERVPPGAADLTFLPYLTPERPHHQPPVSNGAFLGLRIDHQREHLLRAALEGVACGLREALEALPGAEQASALLLAGGGSLYTSWCELLADLLDREVLAIETADLSARGAALLAGLAAGLWPEAAATTLPAPARRLVAVPSGRQAVYEQVYARYREQASALATEWAR